MSDRKDDNISPESPENTEHEATVSTEHQPSIVKTQQSKKSGSGLKILLFLVTLVLVLMISGRHIFSYFFSKEEVQKPAEIIDDESVRVNKRSDLGTQYDPFNPEKSVKNHFDGEYQHDDTSLPDDNYEATKPSQKRFIKYLNVSTSENSSSNSSSGAYSQVSDERNSSPIANYNEQSRAYEPQQVEAIKLDPNLYIEEGTFIPCTLRTRFVSDVAGKISCVISQNIYSANGNTVLIEAGTKANGSYKAATMAHGQARMFVVWDNLRTPDYKKINFANSQAVGGLGEAGVDGWIDSHFWQRFGNAMMLSVITDGMAVVTDQVARKDRSVDYTANSRDAMSEMAKVTLENSINIPPTIYKNQGAVIGILVGEDIDFSNIYKLRIK